MTNLNQFLIGSYSLLGNKLTKQDTTLLISQRKKATKQKAKDFLLRLDQKPAKYISSLYKKAKDTFEFDYNNTKYILTLLSDKAIINFKEGNND